MTPTRLEHIQEASPIPAKADHSREASSSEMALYVHIPFCERKCHYCDFNSGFYKPAVRSRYIDALVNEIRCALPVKEVVSSVFFGGGTPSVLPAGALTRILDTLRASFSISSDAEITVECNPGTIASERMAGETTDSFFAALHSSGVNRLSFGVQSFDSSLLKTLGRIHTPDQAERSVRLAQDAGFRNINVDLMFALPGQTMKHWEDTLEKALDLHVPHISAYSLIVEPETPFAVLNDNGELPRVPEETEAEMYEHVIRRLAECGYGHYEISAFARPGFQCRHNLVYWHNEQYIGFGVGAASYREATRFTRYASLEDYMGRAERGEYTIENSESLNTEGQMSETMMMALRLMDGVERAWFTRRFGVDPAKHYANVLRPLVKQGLLQVTDERIALTLQGAFVANIVWEAFV